MSIIHSMSYKAFVLKAVFVVLLGLWAIVAIGRTFFNLFTLPSDMLDTSVYDRQQAYRKSKAFIQMNMLSEHEVVIDTSDGEFYFLSRNLLYPKRVYRLEESRHQIGIPVVTY